jgi:hypothetical protein
MRRTFGFSFVGDPVDCPPVTRRECPEEASQASSGKVDVLKLTHKIKNAGKTNT